MTITNVATSVGYAAACVFGSQDIAIQILPLITIPLMVFGGFFINLDTIPPYFYPFKFISWHRYGFESFMINLWENINVTTCQPGECVQGESGADILKFHSFETGAVIIARNIGILICMILVFRMIALTALFLRARFMR
uniref:ABC-2 type transporter transmembrane domain-containing protein n=1 Tax=Panagrolaimus sp. JU765 TaxID=591449 RepID=A0AC34R6D8_9BILA